MGLVELCNYFPFEYNKGIGTTAALYGVTLFVLYLYEIHKHYGWLPSISKTFYKVREIFQMFMYLEALSIFLIAQNLLYTIAAICFVIMAMFPSVLYKHFIVPHCIFATTAIAIMTIGLPICFDTATGLILIGGAVVGLSILFYESYIKKNKFIQDTMIYWVEVITLSVSIIGLVLGRII